MIDLYTAATTNGKKISIMLEETRLQYKVHRLKLSAKEQKSKWFLQINPNGRIPAIIDNDNDLTIFESGAILIYLAEKTGKLLPSDIKGRNEVIQWLMFQIAGIGPMQGQANVFYRYAPEKIDYAIRRYQNETKRLYEVLDGQLSGNSYIAGDYSIADIATFPWVNAYEWAGIETDDLTNLRNWLERVGKREAVRKGMNIPPPSKRTEEERIKDVTSILS